MPNGGKRPGAGRPKGSKSQGTLEKEALRELLRQRVGAQMGPLVDAQIENAKGIKYLVVREKASGKFVRVAEAGARAAQGQEIVEVWEKDPCIAAFTDLMNRTIDKPTEHVEADVRGDLVFKWEK